ncbi:TPA: hypothetical protein QCY18_000392 [Bacillus cereus]|uniref:hypothetical protein n=1 Tax=Bacillus TaxID=1386 RepID=UPI0001A115EA|nr:MULTISPECIES: hypothetical protein [Bacillus cereus group]EEL85948.1 hypothetical protein bcere0029_42300 [Bacillus cereus AH1272]EEL90739.1 hypothetical protein bcere0030_53110 [Bacillus cereus AH1273]HDX9501200.1 hypothetical protein [Bacillus thuringiensis]MED1608658.1 hypothetical protein [Bacillus paranthracis]MED1682835.1 hypothetical protein [Bacillus paranthracis]
MKYSNGFFIYKATPLHTPAENELTFTSEMWILKKEVQHFEYYDFTWIVTDKCGFKREINHAPVWIDQNRETVIIFLQNEKLLSEVITSINKKFKLSCVPLTINNTKVIQIHRNNMIISQTSLSTMVRKVKTILLKNDFERLSVIQTILTGG